VFLPSARQGLDKKVDINGVIKAAPKQSASGKGDERRVTAGGNPGTFILFARDGYLLFGLLGFHRLGQRDRQDAILE